MEALESGVFRSDIPCRFRMVSNKDFVRVDHLKKNCTLTYVCIYILNFTIVSMVTGGYYFPYTRRKLVIRKFPQKFPLYIICNTMATGVIWD